MVKQGISIVAVERYELSRDTKDNQKLGRVAYTCGRVFSLLICKLNPSRRRCLPLRCSVPTGAVRGPLALSSLLFVPGVWASRRF
ncbi:unnamed protein product [Arabidopsis halleri]